MQMLTDMTDLSSNDRLIENGFRLIGLDIVQ